MPSSGEFEHGLARANGFSLHAGVVAASDERAKLERLCRTITRTAVSTERLSLTAQGLIHYRLKTPTREGTTHGVFEPLDFMARLAALVPNLRVHLTRYHGAIDIGNRKSVSGNRCQVYLLVIICRSRRPDSGWPSGLAMEQAT